MYENIGKKIKGLAKWTFVIEAVVFFIGGFIGVFLAIDRSNEKLVIFCILTMIIGPLLAWISSWVLYGFGELIDKTTDIVKNVTGDTAVAGSEATSENNK